MNCISKKFTSYFYNKRSKRNLYFNYVRLFAPRFNTALEQLGKRNLFLIVSTGRTGTMLFSQLLNQSQNAYVEHEPIHREQFEHILALEKENNAFDYVRQFRLREIAMRVLAFHPEVKTYGEVNSALRRHIVPFKRYLPDIKLIHIVRNGRLTVNSVMNRTSKNAKEEIYKNANIALPHGIRWKNLTRFERACWLWRIENEYMHTKCDKTLRFEDLITSFSYFKENLADRVGVDVGESEWQKFVGLKVNKTAEHDKVYLSSDWPPEWDETFRRLCSEEMQRYNYEI